MVQLRIRCDSAVVRWGASWHFFKADNSLSLRYPACSACAVASILTIRLAASATEWDMSLRLSSQFVNNPLPRALLAVSAGTEKLNPRRWPDQPARHSANARSDCIEEIGLRQKNRKSISHDWCKISTSKCAKQISILQAPIEISIQLE